MSSIFLFCEYVNIIHYGAYVYFTPYHFAVNSLKHNSVSLLFFSIHTGSGPSMTLFFYKKSRKVSGLKEQRTIGLKNGIMLNCCIVNISAHSVVGGKPKASLLKNFQFRYEMSST